MYHVAMIIVSKHFNRNVTFFRKSMLISFACIPTGVLLLFICISSTDANIAPIDSMVFSLAV